ncbi:unnamed protein product [Orchesella dallaii]|uniref:Gustatory receptor n=1 Tax=Orchesella dallaii TaxID=48710 RepID=A0ABP1S698_9HEXA
MFRRISTKASKLRRRKVSSAGSDGSVAFRSLYPSARRRPALIVTTSYELEHFTFHVFILLKTFLNVCSFLALVPFRLGKNSQGIFMRTRNLLQQILSALLVTLVILYTLLDLRFFLEQNIKEKPEDLFRYATGFIIHIIPICWAMTFWMRADSFDEILYVCQCPALQKPLRIVSEDASISSKQPSWKLIWFLHITIFISFVRFLIRFYVYNGDGSVETYLNFISGNVLYNLYMKDDKFSGIETEERTNSTFLFSATYALAVIGILFDFMLLMFEQFCLTGAVMVYATCGNFHDQLENSKVSLNEKSSALQMNKIIREISSSYLDLVSKVEIINKMFGPSILLFFMYLYPLTVWSIFDRKEDGTFLEALITGYDVVILVAVTGVAAAANGRISKFKQWLFYMSMADLSPHQQSVQEKGSTHGSFTSEIEVDEPILSQDGKSDIRFLLTTMHREVSTEVVGLQGCNFFTITHSFVGTMIGIVITYAIVMLQFMMKPKEGKNCNLNDTRTVDNFTMVLGYAELMDTIAVCLKTYYWDSGNDSSSFMTQ